ncbi:MAG: Fic family protein [Candidatus Neomarinimicrobiota bacterium]
MRVIEKLKGKKKYYYLKHSVRVKGKVVTKEKYIGTVPPDEIAPLVSELRKELYTDIYNQLESIMTNFQEDWKNLPKSIKEQQKQELSVVFTYNTNAIEGSTITENEVRGIILEKIAPGKALRDIAEVESHNKVFLGMLDRDIKITSALLKKWHREIFGKTNNEISGVFRNYQVRVGSFFPPNWKDVKPLMHKLMHFITKYRNIINPVELAAISHYRFEKIHPFGDGNGRIGRLLTNQILWHSKYPLLIIEYKGRDKYYRALTRNEDSFINYFFQRYLAVHKSWI